MVQEGLTNVQKHADARNVSLDIEFGPEEALLTLQDDGAGFDAEALDELVVSPDGGYGLQGLRERLDLVRGRLTVASDSRRGTRLTVVVPRDPAIMKTGGAV